MHLVHSFELVLLLLAAALVLELLARRLHLPPAAMLIIGGIGLALVHDPQPVPGAVEYDDQQRRSAHRARDRHQNPPAEHPPPQQQHRQQATHYREPSYY